MRVKRRIFGAGAPRGSHFPRGRVGAGRASLQLSQQLTGSSLHNCLDFSILYEVEDPCKTNNLSPPPSGVGIRVVCPPLPDVLDQLLLYIVHVKSGAAESQDGEGHLYDMLGRILQHCHYL